MKRFISAVVMVAIAAGSHLAPAPAAQAADVDGGWIGAAPLGSAHAEPPAYAVPPPPPVHYAPPPAYAPRPAYAPPPAYAAAPVYPPAPVYAPAPVYEDEPECRLIRQQYWDGYGYRVRRAPVCD